MEKESIPKLLSPSSQLTWDKLRPQSLLFENLVGGFEVSYLDILLFVKCGMHFLESVSTRETRVPSLEKVNEVSCW